MCGDKHNITVATSQTSHLLKMTHITLMVSLTSSAVLLMSNFHHEMICNRTSCVHDIVEFMVDHWIRIKPFSIQIHA